MSAMRVVLFRRLGSFELRLARLCRRVGLQVRFLEPVGALRSETVLDALRGEGIIWLKASELAGINAFSPIAAGHQLAVTIVDRCFPPDALARLAAMMPPPADSPATLRVLLYELVRGYVMPHGLAVTVARLLKGQGYRVWLWQQEAVLLPLARPGLRNLHPGWLAAALKALRRLRELLARRPADRTPAAVAEATGAATAPMASAEVLFFPHQGPYYGDLYQKSQYYADDPASPFHRDRICHVELAEAVAPKARIAVSEAYARAGIGVHWLPATGRARVSPREFARLAWRIGPVAATLGLKVRHRLAASHAQLSVFPSARLALLGYETQFPRLMAAALQARGIKVAAAQDRFVQPFHPGFHLVLDHYLVHGRAIENEVRTNPLCQISAVSITGDLRLPQRARHRDASRRCLVLDYHSVASPFEDAFAIANGWASNRLFLEDVLHLSEDFPQVQFTIRGKNTNWITLPFFKEVVARTQARPNVIIDRDRSLDRSYALLAESDSVVARHTSLGDQALALGLPVLFHERMATGERSIAAVFDYSPYPLLTRTYDELRAGFARILREGHVLDAAQTAALRREFYAQPANIPAKEQAAAVLARMLAGAAVTSNNVAANVAC